MSNYRDERDEPEVEVMDSPPPHAGALTTAPPRQAGQMMRQDFGGTSLAMTSPQTEALVAAARANAEARWIMAMRNPREHEAVRIAILRECKRPDFADAAVYSRPSGGREKDEKTGEWREVMIEGLSIRFAEVAMRCMRNMQCKATTTYEDAGVRMITVSAVDYETNATWDIDLTIQKTVERKKLRQGQKALKTRVNSYGDVVFVVEATDAQVTQLAGAEISKAARTAILRLVPGDIKDEALDMCKRVASDQNAKDPNRAKRRMLDAFAELGVNPADVMLWLGKPIEQGSRAEFEELSKVASALRERELVWADVLSDRVSEREKAKPAAKPAAPPSEQAQPAQTAPPTSPDQAKPAATTQAAPAQRSTGKGAERLRGALRKDDPKPADPPATPATPATSAPPADFKLTAAVFEERACSGCDALFDYQVGTGKPICGDCAAAAREQE